MNFDDTIFHNLSPQYPYLVIYIQTKILCVFNASAIHVQIATLCKCLACDTKKSKAKSHRLSEGSYMTSLPINNVGGMHAALQHEFGCVCIYKCFCVHIHVFVFASKHLYLFNHNAVMQL